MNPAHSSVKMDWCTPPEVLDRVRQVGPIVLDPCTVESNPVGALGWIYPPDDGLARKWFRPGLVYVNPPYGRELPRWVEKCLIEAAEGSEIILLTPSRTDTRWFGYIWESATAMCFWKGRLKFVGAPDPAPFPSMLAYWGRRPERFREAFAPAGKVVIL